MKLVVHQAEEAQDHQDKIKSKNINVVQQKNLIFSRVIFRTPPISSIKDSPYPVA